MIGGSNLYEMSDGDWGVNVDPKVIKRIQVPTLMIGIGTGWSFAYPKYPSLSTKAREQIHFLHQKAKGSSVRDDITARILRNHGIHNPVVTGCPALYLGDNRSRKRENEVIGISFIPNRMYAKFNYNPRSWRNATYLRRRLMTNVFLRLLARLRSQGRNYKVLVMDSDDLSLAKELLGTDFCYDSSPEVMVAEIATCDVIVGFRLHAGIVGLGFGVPCIPILADGRSAGFAETFKLLELSVPLDPAGDYLIEERIDVCLSGKSHFWEPAIEATDHYRDIMTSFLQNSLF